MKITSNSCNPNKKDQKKTITDSDVSWYEKWDQVCTVCNNDVIKIGELLGAQVRFVMINELTKDPEEEHVLVRAQSECITAQQKDDTLTLETTTG